MKLRLIYFSVFELLLFQVLKSKANGSRSKREDENDVKSVDEYRMGISEFNWDIGISHGNSATLISLATGETYELRFPLPYLAEKASGSNGLDSISLDNEGESSRRQVLSYETLEAEWSNFQIVYMLSDASRNIIYFSHYSQNLKLTQLCLFNISSNQTQLIIQTRTGAIDYLILHDDLLYFSEEKSHTVMKINTSQIDFQQLHSSIQLTVVKELPGEPATGIAIDPSNGNLFWSSTKPSRISYFNGNKAQDFLPNDLGHRVHDIIITDSYLYFITNPQSGSETKIERVSLMNSSEREVVFNFESQPQLPITMTFICGSLFWTDSLSKTLWKLPLQFPMSKGSSPIIKIFDSKLNRHYSNLIPYAVTSRKKLDHATCISRNIIQNSAVSTDAAVTDKPIPPVTVTNPPRTLSKIQEYTPAPFDTNMKLCATEDSESLCHNGGTCLYLEQKLFCLCANGFIGEKCEQDVVTLVPQNEFAFSHSLDCTQTDASLLIFSIILFVIVIILLIVIGILGVKVWRLSRIPRIRRRVIVARKETQKPLPVNVSGMIDIENCCNMNICETPCYDSVTGVVSLTLDQNMKTEDEERLLDY